jgi:hypothetical protein
VENQQWFLPLKRNKLLTLREKMIRLTDILCEGCWEGYKQVGMKEKNGKMVPNCVPVEELYHRPESDVTSDSDFKPDQDNERNQFGSETHVSGHEDEINDGEYCTECLIEVLEGLHENQLGEAEYRGRKVALGKIMRGDVKKFKVFVKDPKSGNIKKVNFGHGGTSAKRRGEKTMKIKKNIPSRRKSFRARHNCDNPGPRTKARYWACRTW